MDQTAIIAKLEQDALFALGFAIDNNPEGVAISLENNGFKRPSTVIDLPSLKKWEFETLKGLLNTDKSTAIAIVTNVKYNKTADNYTAGFNDYFMNKQPASTVTATSRFDVSALLSGLGAGLSSFAATSQVNNAIQAGLGIKTPAQIEADRIAAEQVAAKKRTTNIIVGSILVVAVIVTLVVIFKPKKS